MVPTRQLGLVMERGVAGTWVSIHRFEEGALPPVCAKTGAPANQLVPLRVASAPGWTWLVLAFGVLPFAAVRWLATREVTGLVPMSGPAADRLSWVRLLRFVGLLEATALLLFGLAAELGQAIQLGLGCLAVVTVALVLELAWSVRGRLDRAARGVTLTGVHPAFCEAVGAMAGH
jgi:hypothetical protein